MLGRIVALAAFAMLSAGMATTSAIAQSRKPTPAEIAAVRSCATRNQDDPEQAVQKCLNTFVAGPCIEKLGAAGNGPMADCYYIENAIWDSLLNENYKALLGTLDAEQTAKAQAMQRDWIASRDSTCNFFADKIRGSMAISMTAACFARETARRAMRLKTFSGL